MVMLRNEHGVALVGLKNSYVLFKFSAFYAHVVVNSNNLVKKIE